MDIHELQMVLDLSLAVYSSDQYDSLFRCISEAKRAREPILTGDVIGRVPALDVAQGNTSNDKFESLCSDYTNILILKTTSILISTFFRDVKMLFQCYDCGIKNRTDRQW
jgi:hypothetical protein